MTNLRDPGADAASVVRALGLLPHPEGGHYRETWRDAPPDGGRGAGTAILFLLRAGERSAWHRVDAAELWLWQAGAPLELSVTPGTRMRLGPDAGAGEVLQGLVPAHQWQSAESLGDWTLCSCVVAPAFEFAGFEMAEGEINFVPGPQAAMRTHPPPLAGGGWGEGSCVPRRDQ